MSVTYVYGPDNTDIFNEFSTEDYGLISAANTTTDDFGSTSSLPSNDPNTNEFDWFQVSITGPQVPYGTFLSLNNSLESTSYVFVSGGSISISPKTLTEKVTFTWVGNGTLFEIGNGLERTLRPYVSSGTLRVGTYTIQNEILISSSELTFSLSESATFGELTTIDSEASVSFIANPPEDFVLYTISGFSSDREIQVYGINPGDHLYPQPLDISSGSITIFGELNHPDIDYTPSPDGSGIITISGSGAESFNITNYTGSGSLFGFDSVLESRTFIYDESSIVEGSTDWGSVSLSPTSPAENWQFITGNATLLDWGLLTDQASAVGELLIPFGSWTISGFSSDREIQVYGQDYLTTGTITLSSNLIEKDVDSYIGFGVLSIFDTGLESYSAQTPEDTQLFTVSGIGVESYIAQTPEDFVLYTISGFSSDREIQVYGINPGDHLYPQPEDSSGGLITISGELNHPDIDYTPHYGIEKNIGIGTTGISISGFIEESFAKSNYIGSGSLFGFDSVLESRTFVYDETSIVEGSTDWGSITQTPTSPAENWQFITGNATLLDWGLLTDQASAVGELLIPFGSWTISGFSSDREIQVYGINPGDHLYPQPEDSSGGLITISGVIIEIESESYDGSGILTISGSSLESYSAQTPEDTQLFVISGNGLESYSAQTPEDTQLFVISGNGLESYSAQTPEDTQLFVISGKELVHPDVDYTPHYGIEKNIGIGTTGIQLSGSLVIRETNSYVGSGSLFGIGEKFESRTYVYDENDFILFTSLDYEFISTLPNQLSVDYGNILDPSFGGEDYGLIFDETSGSPIGSTIFPFGSIYILGSADDSFGVGTFFANGNVTISGFSSDREIQVYGQDYLTTGTITLSSNLIEKDVDSYVGLVTLTISGNGLESFGANPPENTQLFNIFGSLVEKDIDSYVGIGTLFKFDSAIEKESEVYQTSGSINIFGSALESDIDSYVGFETSINITGDGLEGKVGFYRGIGIATFSDGYNDLRSTKSWLGLGTIFATISSRNYSNRYPGPGGGLPDNAGIGTIRVNDDSKLTITRAVLPIRASGIVTITGNAFESFTESTYRGTGLYTIFGVSLNREIAVQAQIGLGTIFLAGNIVEKQTDSYVGSGGTISVSETIIESSINSYSAFGSINKLFGGSESFSAQTPEDTQLFNISGIGEENISYQPTETEVLYTLDGDLTERRSYSHQGTGKLTLNSQGQTSIVPLVSGRGLLRYVTHLADNLYDTCDSEEFSCDYIDSAFINFVSNPPENTQLFVISGSSIDQQTYLYSYNGFGTISIDAYSSDIIEIDSYTAQGSLFVIGGGVQSHTEFYNGSGNLFLVSSTAESTSIRTPDNTIILTISGESLTKFEYNYSYIGVGTEFIFGESSTQKITSASEKGNGIILISGAPDIKYIPSPDGSGLISITGISQNSVSYVDFLIGPKNIFVISSGTESFAESTYSGIGTIFLQETSSITLNNPYQIPRVYVTII